MSSQVKLSIELLLVNGYSDIQLDVVGHVPGWILCRQWVGADRFAQCFESVLGPFSSTLGFATEHRFHASRRWIEVNW